MKIKFLALIFGIILLIYVLSGCGQSYDNILKSRSNRIASSPNDICPLLIGQQIPDGIVLKDANGNSVDLSAMLKIKPTLLIFYRGGWCPYCREQLVQLQLIEGRFYELGYQIIAISPDRVEKFKELNEKYTVHLPLLSDSKMDAAKALGIAYKLDEKTYAKYVEYGINIEDASGENHHILPVPATYIINSNGIIEFEYINPNHTTRVDPDIIVTAAEVAARKK